MNIVLHLHLASGRMSLYGNWTSNQSRVRVTRHLYTLFVSLPMEDMSPQALLTTQFESGTLKMGCWLSAHYKVTNPQSIPFVIQATELKLSLVLEIEWSVFGILPIATYFLRWKVIRSLSTPSLALILNLLLSLETMREQSESGMQKSNSSPWTYRHNQVGEVIMFLLWWCIDCLQRGWRIYFYVRHIDWQFFF